MRADWLNMLQVVAIGRCNHKAICAECIVQMILLYKNSQCPLCKGELDQVLLCRCYCSVGLHLQLSRQSCNGLSCMLCVLFLCMEYIQEVPQLEAASTNIFCYH